MKPQKRKIYREDVSPDTRNHQQKRCDRHQDSDIRLSGGSIHKDTVRELVFQTRRRNGSKRYDLPLLGHSGRMRAINNDYLFKIK